MKKLPLIAFVLNCLYASSQCDYVITSQQGLEICYRGDFYANTNDCGNAPSEQWKVTIYFSNNSGKKLVDVIGEYLPYVKFTSNQPCGSIEANLSIPYNSGDITNITSYILLLPGSSAANINVDQYILRGFKFIEANNSNTKNTNSNSTNLNLSNDVVTYNPQQQLAQQQLAQYSNLIQQANDAYTNRNYTLALQLYKDAMAINSSDPKLQDKIQEIIKIKEEQDKDKQQEQQQLKSESKDLIKQADENMKNADYKLAQQQYADAASKDPNNSYIKNQQQKAQVLQQNQEKKAKETKIIEEQKNREALAAAAEKERKEILQEHNNADKQAFENMKKQQEENAKHGQEVLFAGGAAFAGLIAAGISNNNNASYYRGHGFHLGLNLGLTGVSIPFATHFTENKYDDYGTYQINKRIDSSIVSNFPFGTGITGGVDLNPLLSEYISVGAFFYGTAGFSPIMIVGGGNSVSTPDGNGGLQSSTSFIFTNLNYGLIFTLGFKPTKLLFEISENRCHYNYTDVEIYTYQNSNYTYHDNTIYDFDVNYIQIKKGIGLRLIPYEKKWSIDLMYYFNTPVDQQKKWALSTPDNLFKLRIWKQSIFKFDATLGFNINSLSNDIKYNDRKNMNGLYINFTFMYCKDFFSKSYIKLKKR